MKRIISSLFLCLALTFILAGCGNSKPKLTVYEQIIENWLTDLQNGGDGSTYWKNPNFAAKFYAVRDWKILGEENVPTGSDLFQRTLVKVRIDSSTKGGFQITKIWTVEIWDQKIFQVLEN